MTSDASKGVWERMKSRSLWHFDYSKPAELGKDSYTPVCNFNADWTLTLEKLEPLVKRGYYDAKQGRWVESDGPVEGIYTENYMVMDIQDEPLINKIPLVKKLLDYLGMERLQVNLINQLPGVRLMLHIDHLGKHYTNDMQEADKYLEDPDSIRRFVVMLKDWQPGQVFNFGNAAWTRWKSGDCATWEWRDIPHSTSNTGWWDRPMLQITGLTTERTRQVLIDASQNNIVNFD